jgi:hypothetical protein
MITYLYERRLLYLRVTDHEYRDDPYDIKSIYINGQWQDVSVDHIASHIELAKQIRTLCNYDYVKLL